MATVDEPDDEPKVESPSTAPTNAVLTGYGGSGLHTKRVVSRASWSGLPQAAGSHLGARVRIAARQAKLQEPVGLLAGLVLEEDREYRLASIAGARNVSEQGGA